MMMVLTMVMLMVIVMVMVMVMVMLSMSTPILTNLNAVFRYSSFLHTYHPLGSSHVNLLGCLPCQLWRRKEGKVLKSV